MNDILIYILMAVIGGFIGKKIQNIYPWMDTLQNSFLIFLIASLGIKIGTNDDVMRNFGRLGIYAFIFTIVIMLGSIGAVSLLKKIFITGKSAPVTSASPSVSLQEKPDYRKDPSGEDDKGTGAGIKKVSLMIIGSLTFGIIIGFVWNEYILEDLIGNFIKFGLCALLFFVGFEFGVRGNFIESLKLAGPYAVIVPVGVILGTFAGSVVISFFMPISIREGLAIGSGFGWYSLAPSIMMDKGYVMAGTISFMHNIMRELIGILAIPLVAKKVGYAESVSLPGSSCMDVCLPIIEKSASSEAALYSFFTGGVLAILTPVLVAGFLS